MSTEVKKEVKYVDYTESWYVIECPYCAKSNAVCNGNEEDLSGVDVEGVRCYSCKEVFILGERDGVMVELHGGDYPDGNWHIEDGVNLDKGLK